MRIVPFALIIVLLHAVIAFALPQKAASPAQKSKDSASGISKQDAEAETQLQKAMADFIIRITYVFV